MATISKYFILKPCALVTQNTVKAPNLHLRNTAKMSLQNCFKNGQLLERVIRLDIHVKTEVENCCMCSK